MFNKENEKSRALVRLTLAGGKQMQANLLMAPSSTVSRTINSDVQFLEFEDLDGVVHMVAKPAIVEVVATSLPKVSRLDIKDADKIGDPYQALGLKNGASAEELHAAYRSLRETYNPENFLTIVLPAEVSRYITSKYAHIEAAYRYLTGGEQNAA